MMYAAQEEVIAALRSNGDRDLAERLEDCATARLARHSGSGCRTFADLLHVSGADDR